MTKTFHRLTLISLALAASMQLAACGGGSAGAPDIFPPTVVITSDAATTASGPVTFTFNFNEDVGSSFSDDDIVVTGGTPGPLTRVSATQYTMVVTPPETAAGTIQVTVASGSFADAVGNSNTVNPTVAVSFNTGVVGASGNTGTCSAPCIDFTAAPPAVDYEGFGGTVGTWETDPVDGTNKVAKLVKTSGAQTWAGVTIFTNAADKSVTPANFGSSKIITLRVFSPAAGKTVRIKFEDAADNTRSVETDATTTVAGAWETLTFDIANQASGTAAYNAAYTYNKVSVFVDFGASPAAEEIFYIDELKYPAASEGGTGGGSGGGSVLLSFDEAASPFTSDPGVFGDAAIDIAAGPTGGSGKALKLSRSGALNFGGTFFGIAPVPFTAERKVVTARVNATRAGAVVYLKVEVPGGTFVELPATVSAANTWETLTWNLSGVNPGNSYSVMVFSADTDVNGIGAQTYWIDDVTLAAASNGGGGATTLVYASNYTESPTPWRSTEGGDAGRYAAEGALDWWSGLASGDATPSYYFGYGLLPTDWGFGAYVNAPNNGTANVSGYSNVRISVWGNDELVNQNPRPNFNLIMQAPAVAGGCIPEVQKEFQVTGAGVQAYTIALSGMVMRQDCGQPTLNTPAAILATGVKSVHVQVTTPNLNKSVGLDAASGRYPNGLNIGPISFN